MTFFQDFIGKYVICRTRNEGINAGVVKKIDETGLILEHCRRLHYHEPLDKNKSWYEGVSQTGITKNSRVSTETTKLIVEDYSLTLCSDIAEKSIREFKDHAQS